MPGSWHVFPEHAAAGLWSTPTDLAKLLVQLADVWQGLSSIFLRRQTLEEMLTPQNGGPYGLGAAIAGEGASLVLMKRGHSTQGNQAVIDEWRLRATTGTTKRNPRLPRTEDAEESAEWGEVGEEPPTQDGD